MKKKILIVLMVLVILLAGCQHRQSTRVSHNVSLEADNFNVIRRLTVLNARTDKPMFELIGAFSFELQSNRIIVVVETGPNEYKKHSVGLGEWTLWVVEDVGGANVDKYRYEVNFLPEMIVPITFTSND
ncbi:hypothetical protein CIW83_18290 [Tissierella sp. P1]|uniref:beta-sandwich lipoprotein n=1 Tax=Tissierella sp. P1 TaxID=1280483 RepID=UPI000BA02DCB|nr:hypothetical protein [Tissierella sp. P1]OZV10769.1 hypothetical protein CIW83_18290 [Tissierella sp. P1]